MRTLPIAAAALALMATAAVAQTPPPRSSPASPAPSATTAPVHKQSAVNPLTQADISNIEGTAVYGSDNTELGHVSTVLMDPLSKKIDRLVVSAGGVIGIGSHRVAIPVDQFTWDGDKGGFKLSQTMAELKSMPEWVEGGTETGSSQAPSKPAPDTDTGDSNSTK